MKKRYVPLDKMSKRQKKEYHAMFRGSWGGVNPVTRKPPDPRAYNRKKSGQRHEDESPTGFFLRKILNKPFHIVRVVDLI